jgi:hypothetical protein
MLKVFQLPGKDVAPKPGAKLVQKVCYGLVLMYGCELSRINTYFIDLLHSKHVQGFLSLTGCRITRRPNTPNTESNLEFSVLNESNNCVDFKASNEEELESTHC